MRDVGSDLITAVTNARPDGGVDIRGSSTELTSHLFDCGFNYFSSGPAPAGMNGRDGAVAAIEQQDGNTIRGSNADALPNLVRDQSIALALAILRSGCV